jgi:hypothetical protein
MTASKPPNPPADLKAEVHLTLDDTVGVCGGTSGCCAFPCGILPEGRGG